MKNLQINEKIKTEKKKSAKGKGASQKRKSNIQ